MDNDKNKATEITKVEEQDGILDFSGLRTGVPLDKKVFFGFGAAILVYIVCSLFPINHYGENTSKALGLLFGTITLSIFGNSNIVIPAFTCTLAGIAFGLWDFAEVSNQLGSSPMYTMVGMMIVALGCEFTPFGKRLAYWFLKKFGQKPVRMVFVIAFVTAFISTFLSNLATMIMMSGIAATLLNAMDEKPGESRIGKAMMLLITCMAMVGGSVLISGSPSGNLRAVSFLETSTGGAYSITFGQWAAFGIPSFAIVFIPICLVYIKYTGLKDSDVKILPKSYYEEKLNSLGKIGGSEYRWIIITISMIITLIKGMKIGQAALLFALIAMLPGIGVVKPKQALGKIPWDNVLALTTFPLLGVLFTTTGLGDFITDLLKPLVGNMGPLSFSIFTAIICGIVLNLFVNANIAVCAMIITIFSPVCVSLGYNPTVLMAPTLMMVSFFFCMGNNTMVLINKGYGYWEMKDPMIPGFISIFILGIVYPIVAYVVGPMIGLSIYL